ncbi:mucin-2-like [Macrobrachium nipponense]|uniref:mucin-2-like n=1 Tax=Macrobrachium nipponense TaxID=159736 RepID=UPI0030C852DC
MERLVGLAVFLPLVCAQIIFPNEVRTSRSSTNSSASLPPGLQGSSSPSLTTPAVVSVNETEVNQQSQETQLPSASRTRSTDVNLTVISSLEPIAPRIPGSFSAQPATITPTLEPSPVAFTPTVSSSSAEVHAVAEEDSHLPSRTSTTTETQQVFTIPSRVGQSVARVTPKPTFVSRTVPPSFGASDFPHSRTDTNATQVSFATPNPVGLNTESPSKAEVRPFVQSSQTDEGFPSSITSSFVTPPISVTTTSFVSTSTSPVSEDSEDQDQRDSTDNFQNTTPASTQDPSTSAHDVDDHLVISIMEDNHEPSSNGADTDLQPCITPLGETGNCIQLTSCQGYNPLKSKTDSSIAVNFLRGRVCRILPRSLLFCCPVGDPILPVSF